MVTLVPTIGEGSVVVRGGMSSIAEATPTAKDRSCREVCQYELAPLAGLVMDTPTGNSESEGPCAGSPGAPGAATGRDVVAVRL